LFTKQIKEREDKEEGKEGRNTTKLKER